MRKNFGSKTYLFPQPVLIIGTYNSDGTANAMNAAWGGIAEDDEIMICLASHQTTDNIQKTKSFTVSMGTVETVVSSDYVGIVSAKKDPDKMKKSGFTVVKSDKVNAPLFAELPVTLECELVKIIDEERYIGKIKNVTVDESVLADDGEIDLSKFHPLIYEPARHGYYEFGKKVADAFKVGTKLK